MPARESPRDRGRRTARRSLAEVVGDLRSTRLALGLTQEQVANAAGVSRSYVGRLERDEIKQPGINSIASVAAALGLRLRLALYPEGEPIRDRVQLRLLGAFRARLHPSLGWRTEVPLPIQGDRRAWDAVVIAHDGWTAIEAISRLGAVDATLR
ncbi:MAG TPA: helix-turn-helix transcriptional regulator, partial [Candidatus Limnocylindrales bacterium]